MTDNYKESGLPILPLFLGVGDEQLQIGEIVMLPRKGIPGYFQLLGSIDAFPGERLTFSRMVNWDEFIQVVKARFPIVQAEEKVMTGRTQEEMDEFDRLAELARQLGLPTPELPKKEDE